MEGSARVNASLVDAGGNPFFVPDDHAVELCQGHPNFRFGSIEVRELDFMGGPEKLELS